MTITTIVSESATILQDSAVLTLTLVSGNTASGMIAQQVVEASDALASAQDAARFSANIYQDTAIGLAATVSGDYFMTLSAVAGEYAILYANTAGVAVEQKRFPTASAMAAAIVAAAAAADSEAATAADAIATAADAVATDADRIAAEAARDATYSAAQSSGVYIYDTKALATAAVAGLADLAIVEVLADELQSGSRTRYRKEGGLLVFKFALEDAARVRFQQAGTGAVARTAQDKMREVVNLSDYGVISGASNQSVNVQKAADAAKARGVPLRINAIGPATTYAFTNIDVSGLDVIVEPGVSLVAYTGATGYSFIAVGTALSRITTPTRIFNARLDGGGTMMGVFSASYCDDPQAHDCKTTNIPTGVSPDGSGAAFVECIRPRVIRGRYEGGRQGVLFNSCTNPVAYHVVTNGQGRDGILFYTGPTGTTTTDAESIGCIATDYSINGDGGRAGIHFYGVRRAKAIAPTVSDDNSQPHDDTGAIRFRDCEDFYTAGYTASNCRTGVLVNEIGDYASAPHSIVVRGEIGQGNVSDIVKYGIFVAVGVHCQIIGARVRNVSSLVNSCGISHAGHGPISGCLVAACANTGIIAIGENAVVGNTLIRSGNGGVSLPGISVSGRGLVSGNTFSDDRGSPLATLAIRVRTGAITTIGENSYGAGITDFVQADSGSTVRRDSAIIRQKFSGVPGSLAGTIEVGVRAVGANGIVYIRTAAAWRRVDTATTTATIGVTETTVAHGLGYVPTSISITPGADARVWQSAAADATNVYLTASVSVSCLINIQ